MRDGLDIGIDTCMSESATVDTIIDVRSPGEFALDHIPGAINLPVLDDAQRAHVGTLNAQVSSFDAKRVGATLVARNIADIIEQQCSNRPPDWRPVVYCWRGGNRSASLATVLARIGWHTRIINGGYKSYRRWVVESMNRLVPAFDWRVVAGRTGSGKSRILQELAKRGAQMIDLESLANHRGSILGLLPTERQPTQKRFETCLIDQLRRLDVARPVYVESESRKIGRIQVPEPLINRIRESPCLAIERPIGERARFLTEEYGHFLADPGSLIALLEKLRVLHGTARLAEWQRSIEAGEWRALVESLLAVHYDPSYDKSMANNFSQLPSARTIRIDTIDDRWIGEAADRILDD